MFERFSWSVGGLLLAGLRVLNDLSILLFCIGGGIFISACVKRVKHAIAWAYSTIPMALMLAMGLEAWVLFGLRWLKTRDPAYCLFAPLAMVLRLLLAAILVRAAARKFTALR